MGSIQRREGGESRGRHRGNEKVRICVFLPQALESKGEKNRQDNEMDTHAYVFLINQRK